MHQMFVTVQYLQWMWIYLCVLQLFAADEETRNEILQLKKEDAEIQEDMALSEAAFVKAEQKNEMLQAEYQKVWRREFGIDQACASTV